MCWRVSWILIPAMVLGTSPRYWVPEPELRAFKPTGFTVSIPGVTLVLNRPADDGEIRVRILVGSTLRPLDLSSASPKPILWDGGREGEMHGVATQPTKVSFRANKNRWITETVDDDLGVQLFAFHGSVNKPLYDLEAGDMSRDVLTPHQGRWVFEEPGLRLRPGDIIYFWLYVQVDGLGYRKDHQYWIVKRIEDVPGVADPTFVPPPHGAGVPPVRHEYEVPPAVLEASCPRGLKVSIPDSPGVEVFAFHGNINKPMRDLEAGMMSRDILMPHEGLWVFKDETIKLHVGDIVYYWLFVIVHGLGYRKDHQMWTVTELTGNRSHLCPYEGEQHSLPHIPIPAEHPPPPYQHPNSPAEPGEHNTPVVPASSSTDSLTPLNGTKGTLPEGLEFVVVVKDGKLQPKEKLPDHITRPLRAKRAARALRNKHRISKPVNQNLIDFELMCGEEPNINGRYNYNLENWEGLIEMKCTRICVEEEFKTIEEKHLQCIRPGLNSDLAVFGSLFQHESRALDHADTEPPMNGLLVININPIRAGLEDVDGTILGLSIISFPGPLDIRVGTKYLIVEAEVPGRVCTTPAFPAPFAGLGLPRVVQPSRFLETAYSNGQLVIMYSLDGLVGWGEGKGQNDHETLRT
uniref:CBM39 domain-containing protein n=1 Tax=Timema douglasi TaxID=61478 RepID=A0A7R8VK36_TIMDO|nr:unnamed protein product [Timema douglasi]